MTARVFLSLSYVDADFVREVRSRLPIGLAHFYEKSFDNGEALLHAMENKVQESQIFVLFASKEGLKSAAVQFEIEQARVNKAFNPNVRLLIFPTSPDVSYSDLPKWMQSYWMGQSGYTPADVARYITTVLLEPNVGVSSGAVKILGRGKTLDLIEQVAADHLQRTKKMPSIYVLAGFTGIGRRTFASYYMRAGLSAESQLPYGPSILLAAQAELVDVYRGIRSEIDGDIAPEKLSEDLKAFSQLSDPEKTTEISRILGHFSELGQSVTLISTSGFFEDSGEAKSWVLDLFQNLPIGLVLFVVTNRQFDVEFIEVTGTAIQVRVEELADKDIRALMIHTAERMKVESFDVPDEIVKAIGGHPDVANAAVRLAAQRGVDVLKRQPGYLYNVQRTILGETISEEALSATDRAVLDALCWVPSLGGDLLEEIVASASGADTDAFVATCQALVMSCLVTAQGFTYAISPAIRQLYRRWYVTDPKTLDCIAKVLSAHWKAAVEAGRFREDLFEAFVFMHAFQGEELPDELKGLLTPGTLETVIKETYALGKTNDDAEALKRVVSWGAIANDMDMSPAVREEIMNAVARAQIRVGSYADAQRTIDSMKEKEYASSVFLLGHLFRRKRDYERAIPFLEEAVRGRKFNRSAVHELALAYHRSGQTKKLGDLLSRFEKLLNDSAMFLDLSIGIQLRSGASIADVPAKIRRLRAMPDDDGRADLREAQLMLRDGRFDEAKDFITDTMNRTTGSRFHLRTLRAMAAINAKDYGLARRDIEFIRSLPGRENVAQSLQADLSLNQGKVGEAEAELRSIDPWTPDEWQRYARILEHKAAKAVGLSERQAIEAEIADVIAKHGKSVMFATDFD